MPLFIFKCEKCGSSKQHFFSTESTRVVSCAKCGETEKYKKQMGRVAMKVKHSTLADKLEAEIDPWVEETYKKIGTEMVAGDVKTLQNVFGEEKLAETYYEDETWVDEEY